MGPFSTLLLGFALVAIVTVIAALFARWTMHPCFGIGHLWVTIAGGLERRRQRCRRCGRTRTIGAYRWGDE